MTDFPVVVPCPVLWGDMDALGHVNNTRYFRWFESARIRYFELVQIFSDQPSQVGPILATTTCDFKIPVTYPNQIEACAGVSKLGTTSFQMDYLVRLADGPTAASGSATIVLLDYEKSKTVPLSDQLRERITQLG